MLQWRRQRKVNNDNSSISYKKIQKLECYKYNNVDKTQGWQWEDTPHKKS